MQSRLRWALVLGSLIALAVAPEVAVAQAKNPCNPCGGEGAEAKKMVAVNPCHAKMGTIFYVSDRIGRDSVSFTSEAFLESFVGTTTQIKGYVVFDPNDPTKGGKGVFEVPVKSIDTGIPLRDEHLRSGAWLGAEKNPTMKYEISGAKDVKEISNKGGARTFELTLVGTFHLHGKSKALDIPAKISYMKESPKTMQYAPGDLLAARANFSINLKDFGITGPPGMDLIGSKVAASPSIQIRFTASTKDPSEAGNRRGRRGRRRPENPCNPCGGKAEDK